MNLFDESARSEIVARINKLTPESKAAWGKMNISEMLCHCADGMKMASGDIKVADKSNFFLRTFIKPLVIYVLPMPKNAPAADEINPLKQGTKPKDFEESRRCLIDCINESAGLPKDHNWGRHHLFGQLSYKQYGLLGYKHLDHHLKQFGV